MLAYSHTYSYSDNYSVDCLWISSHVRFSFRLARLELVNIETRKPIPCAERLFMAIMLFR